MPNIDPILHEVFTVRKTDQPDAFILDVELTDFRGERYRCEYVSHPDDDYGLNPTIRKWLVANDGEYTAIPYIEVVPTIEEIRESMPKLTSRQFWMAAANIDVDKDLLVTSIKTAMPDSIDRKMKIAELEASTFERLNPTVIELMELMGIPAEQVDALWMWAADL